MLTVDDLKLALPANLKTAATQSLADMVNNITTDPEMARNIRDNFVGYTHVLKEGRFKTEDYLSGVAYVSYKLMGYTNQESYKRTFPARYQALVAKGATEKDISAYVSSYNKNKLVNMILEQTLVPVWVLNQDLYQKAINVQANLMLTANSEKVRTDAANSLLTHLKKPETKQIELSLAVPENAGMDELKTLLTSLAHRQQEMIAQGVTTKEIAHQSFANGHTTSHHTEANHLTPGHIKASDVIDAVVVETIKPASPNGAALNMKAR